MIVYEMPIKDGLRDIVAKAIRKNGAKTDIGALYEGVIGCTATVTENVRKNDPPVRDIACDAGCSYCCYQYDVGATPFEVLCIAAFIDDTFSREERDLLLTRITAAQARKDNHPIEDWGVAKFPCPLLVDDRCSVYETRPLICRAMNSYSFKRCRKNKETPHDDSSVPMYGHQYEIAKFARAGVQRGLAEAALQNEVLELVPALRIALTTPGAALRWLAGERIFEEAVSRLPPRSRQTKNAANDVHNVA